MSKAFARQPGCGDERNAESVKQMVEGSLGAAGLGSSTTPSPSLARASWAGSDIAGPLQLYGRASAEQIVGAVRLGASLIRRSGGPRSVRGLRRC
jgi:hypothetical protein